MILKFQTSTGGWKWYDNIESVRTHLKPVVNSNSQIKKHLREAAVDVYDVCVPISDYTTAGVEDPSFENLIYDFAVIDYHLRNGKNNSYNEGVLYTVNTVYLLNDEGKTVDKLN